MFGDRNAASGDDEGGGGGDIVGADAITASADNIHGTCRRLDEAGLGAHDAGGGGDILDALTTHFQRNQEGRHLNLADLALHDRVKTAPDRVRGGHFAIDEGQQRAFHYVIHHGIHSNGDNAAYKQVCGHVKRC